MEQLARPADRRHNLQSKQGALFGAAFATGDSANVAKNPAANPSRRAGPHCACLYACRLRVALSLLHGSQIRLSHPLGLLVEQEGEEHIAAPASHARDLMEN
jgi:hypothetical protein